MQFFFKLLSEKHDAHEEKVDGATNRFMVLDDCPGLFHFPAPVNVIKNKDRIIMNFVKYFPEISFCGFFLMSRIANTPSNRASGAGRIKNANSPAYPAAMARPDRPTGSNIRMAALFSMSAVTTL